MNSDTVKPKKKRIALKVVGGIAIVFLLVAPDVIASTLPLGNNWGWGSELQQSPLGTIERYIEQVRNLRQRVLGRLRQVIGRGRSELSEVLRDALGVLNLPDPDELFDEIFGEIFNDREFDRNSLGQVNPTVARSIMLSTLNTETARLDASRVLSSESQQQIASDIQQVQGLINTAAQQSEGTGRLAGQSSNASKTSSQLSEQTAKLAEESKNRVSTQDAIKDLNQMTGNISGQLAQLGGQGAVQSGQLANISGQLGASVDLEGRQLLRMNQVVTGVAVANQNIADLNEAAQGERRIRIAETNAQVQRSLRISRLGYRLNLGSKATGSQPPQNSQSPRGSQQQQSPRNQN